MPTNSVDRFSVYIAAGLISGCGALMFNVMPVFVGALSREFSFDDSQLGDIVSAFNIGFTFIAIASMLWVRRINWRLLSAGSVTVAALGLLGMSFVSGFRSIALFTGLVGLGMGSLYALIMAILGDSDDPDKAFGLKLGLETLPGAFLLFLLPAVIVPAAGFAGVAYAIVATLIVLGLASFSLPASGSVQAAVNRGQDGAVKAFSSLVLPVLGVLSSLAFFTGISASWAFLELLGNAGGLHGDTIGVVLAVGFVICGLGGFAAATIGDRFGRAVPVVGIALINWAGLWQLGVCESVAGYAVGACLFLFSVNFTLAYTFGLTAEVDGGGKLVVLSAAGLSGGAVIGPAVSGRLAESGGYTAMLSFSALCTLAAVLLYFLVMQRARANRLSPGPANAATD